MNWMDMLFQGWSGLIRTAVVAVLAYGGLVLFLRVLHRAHRQASTDHRAGLHRMKNQR